MLTALLCVAAFVAGLTGAWSPCGFSMVATIGEHGGSRRLKLAACVAFVPGALLGGVVTFGLAALIGSAVGGGSIAIALAAAVAGAGAIAEAAGVKIAPQIRRQVPEHWRRTWPLPLAVAAYGVLLGLGFTTFVLTFAVPVLAGVALALGSVSAGVLMGLAFGLGRALPVAGLAPFATAPLGLRATELMAERPAILRGFRAADALALAACAVVLAAGGEPASAATPVTIAAPASNPSAEDADLAYTVPGEQRGALLSRGVTTPLPASHPVIGDGLLAVIVGDQIRVARRDTGEQLLARDVPGVDAVAVSAGWLAYRRNDRVLALPLAGGATRTIASAPGAATVGRPSLDGDRVVFHVAGTRSSRIDEVDLAAGKRRTLRRSTRRLLTNPSVRRGALLYVDTTPYSQSLRLGARSGSSGRVLMRIAPAIEADKGYSTKHGPHRPATHPKRPAKQGSRRTTTTLWTTALGSDAAYVTRLRSRGGRTTAAIVRVAR